MVPKNEHNHFLINIIIMHHTIFYHLKIQLLKFLRFKIIFNNLIILIRMVVCLITGKFKILFLIHQIQKYIKLGFLDIIN